MISMQEAITSVILAATDQSGMGPDYFENKTRHILQVADKPLISHLVDTLDKDKRIGDKYFVIEERITNFQRKMTCESSYREIFKNRIGRDIHLFGQDPLTKVGTFEAVRGFIEHEDKIEKFPLLICYGDTLIEYKLLKNIIDKYFEMKSNSAKIVWGLIRPKEDFYLLDTADIIDPLAIVDKIANEKDAFSRFIKERLSPNVVDMLNEYKYSNILSDDLITHLISGINKLISGPIIYKNDIFPNKKLMSIIKNAKDCILEEKDQSRVNKFLIEKIYQNEIFRSPKFGGYVVTEKVKPYSEFSELDSDKIINIFEDSAINFEDSIRQLSTFDDFIDTGIMIISREAWDKIIDLVEKVRRPSPLGVFSLVNIIKQILILRGLEIRASNPEISDRAGRIKYQEKDETKSEEIYNFEELKIDVHCVLGSEIHWAGITYPWELLELNNKQLNRLVEGTIWSENEIDDIGKKTIYLPKGVAIEVRELPDIVGPCKIEGPCILGKNLKFGGNVYIKNSFIGDGTVLENFVSIRNSNLVKGVQIHENCVIDNCIIMDNTNIYCNSVIVSSVVGKSVLAGIGTKCPCKRLREIKVTPRDRKVTYFSDILIKKVDAMGAVIGDYCQIGSGSLVHPGRRIARRSIIPANSQVLKNIRLNIT
jgi:NDP-sugar pyrophosphorylase family protein